MASIDYQNELTNLIEEYPTKERIIKDLATLTMTSKSVVYRWLSGSITPPPVKQKIIADYFKKEVSDLFPRKQSNERC